MNVVVDTDVVSFLFKKDSRAGGFRPFLHEGTIISFMTLAELRAWTLHRRWGLTRRLELHRFLQAFPVHFSNDSLCQLWAEVTSRAKTRGMPMEVADAWIAATALALGVPLVTNNPQDYAGVEGLTLLTAEG